MDILLKQNIDKNNFNVFIRDLSSSLNTNLKHIIEDTLKTDISLKPKKKGKGKKVVIKKKDLIIAEITKKRAENILKDDLQKVEFLFDNKDINDPFNSVKLLKSKEGIDKMKYLLLEFYWSNKERNKYMNYIISLYYQLKDVENNDYKELVELIGTKLQKYEYKLYMMKELGYLLPPLNFWDNPEKKLDDWQKEVINIVNKKESCLVKAPTSAGKTWIAMSTGIIHKKILYICPAKPVAYQVGSHFMYMGYKVHFLIENLSHHSYDKKTNIFIGTPYEIEKNLYKLNEKFDYVVFDEIHNLNKKDDGDIYENLLKIIDCNFLALSATIKNINFLKEIFHKNFKNKKIHYIEYNKRFINHQKWLWNQNKLIKLHPLCCFKTINENFVNYSLSFTPNDCASLWNKIEDEFCEEEEDYYDDFIDELSPDNYFKEEKLLTLDDCTLYENFIKKKLIELNNDYPKKIQNIFNSFQINYSSETEKDNDIIKFIRNVKKKDMLPMIMFHINENSCKNIFNKIYDYLDQKELEEYPYHYIILEKKQKLYEKFVINKEEFISSINIKTKN